MHLKQLGLKSIVTLILEEYPEINKKFLEKNKITLFQFGVAGNKVRNQGTDYVDCGAYFNLATLRNHLLISQRIPSAKHFLSF